MLNPKVRQTQNRIIKLFTHQLGYTYYGNWEKRAHNSNVEETYLKSLKTETSYE